MIKKVKTFNDFRSQEEVDRKYWQAMNPNNKVEILNQIRQSYFEMNNITCLKVQKVLKILQLTEV
ncbi:MAG: hypothetical protein HQK84_05560 [Nitrospinae bacterium]|nr:hypothetical protein [Nitrospinota bacterium]